MANFITKSGTQLISLLGNSQQLDGGAMFGHVPKALWSQWIKPDTENRIPLACRCLLIKEPKRNLLLETGVGAFFAPKLKERYGVVESDHVLLNSLQAHGLTPDDIDVVILSHLHFDHAGGLLSQYQENQPPHLVFPKATFVTSEVAWQRACSPHVRDKASFIPELTALLEQSGRLVLVKEKSHELLGNQYCLHYSSGHTPGMLLTEIELDDGQSITFAADLIPGHQWVHLPVTMGYDRAPEQLIDEKQAILNKIANKDSYLFYTHDADYAASKVIRDEKGKFSATDCINEFN